VSVRIGDTQTITFNHNLGAGQPVHLDVSRNGGATWNAIGETVTSAATSSTCAWTVTGPSTAQARIRVSTADGTASDISDVNFAILDRITVTSPNGSGTLRTGATQTITFTHTLGIGQPVRLDVSRNGGITWTPIATVTTTNPVSG